MFGKSEPNTTRSATSASRAGQSAGSGAIRVLNAVPTIVVSRYTRSWRCTRSSASTKSGIPAWASTTGNRGCSARTSANRSSPVNSPGAGPWPQCTTAGTPASASSPHAGRSNRSRGSNPPTCTCTFTTRAPAATATPR